LKTDNSLISKLHQAGTTPAFWPGGSLGHAQLFNLHASTVKRIAIRGWIEFWRSSKTMTILVSLHAAFTVVV
jgi:hypothetical protein